MCWSIFLLGLHPEIQEKVYQEVVEVLQENNTPKNLTELNQLKYLECVIKEALRLYPSVPFISRLLSQDIQLGNKIYY